MYSVAAHLLGSFQVSQTERLRVEPSERLVQIGCASRTFYTLMTILELNVRSSRAARHLRKVLWT